MSLDALTKATKPLNDAANAVNGAVKDGFSLFGFIFQALIWGPIFLLGGGWLLNNFHEQPWLKPVMEFFAPMVEGLLSILPDEASKWLRDNVLGNFAQYLTADGTRGAIAAAAGKDLAKLIIRDGEEGKQDLATLQRVLDEAKRLGTAKTINIKSLSNPATLLANPALVTAVLLDQDGRAMLKRLIGYTPPAPSDGEQAATNPLKDALLQAMQNLFNNKALLSRITSDQEAMALLYEQAEKATSVTITQGAQTALTKILQNNSQQLAALMPNAEGKLDMKAAGTALEVVLKEKVITTSDLHAIIKGITISSPPEPFKEVIKKLKALDVKQLTAIRTTLKEHPELLTQVLAVSNQGTETIAKTFAEFVIKKSHTFTPKQLVSLAPLLPLDGKIADLLQGNDVEKNNNNAGSILALMHGLGAESFGKIAGAIEKFVQASLDNKEPLPSIPELIKMVADEVDSQKKLNIVVAFLKNTGIADQETINAIPKTITELQAVNNLASALPIALGEQQTDFFNAIAAIVANQENKTKALQALGGILANEDILKKLKKGDIPKNLATVIVTKKASDDYATKFMYDFLGDEKNIKALIGLALKIDDATGGGEAEAEADARNGRVLSFLMQVMSKEKPKVTNDIVKDFNALFKNQKVVEALQDFLGKDNDEDVNNGVNTSVMTEKQKNLINVLKEHLWIDSNENSALNPIGVTMNDRGLATFLGSSNYNSVRFALKALAGNLSGIDKIPIAISSGDDPYYTFRALGESFRELKKEASPPR